MALVTIPGNEMNQFDLPRVCLLSGATQDVVFKEMKFQYIPPWARIFGALIQVLVARKAKGELPFSEESWKAMKSGQLLFGLSIVGTIVVLSAGGVASGALENPAPFFLSLIAAIALPIVVYQLKLKGRSVRCTNIEKTGEVTLDIPSPEAASMIERHLSGSPKRAGALKP